MGKETGLHVSIEIAGQATSVSGSDMCLGNNKLTFCNKYLMTLICKIASRSKIGLALTELGFPCIPKLGKNSTPAIFLLQLYLFASVFLSSSQFTLPTVACGQFICGSVEEDRACNVLANPLPAFLSAIF